MPQRPLKLAGIIVEALLEDRVLRDLRALSVPGYTRSEVRGEGRRHIRDPFEGSNIKLELLVSPALAERIIAVFKRNAIWPTTQWSLRVADVQAVIAEHHIVAP